MDTVSKTHPDIEKVLQPLLDLINQSFGDEWSVAVCLDKHSRWVEARKTGFGTIEAANATVLVERLRLVADASKYEDWL